MNEATGNKSLHKALGLLEVIIASRGSETLQILAKREGIPLPTAWRMATTFVDRGFLRHGRRGYYLPGAQLRRVADTVTDTNALASLARPLLKNLAAKLGCVAHLGVLDEDMVTYLVREGSKSTNVPTQEGTQLEGYCSAIGKVLLSERSTEDIDTYLQSGEFVPLTLHTITDPEKLKLELDIAAQQGFALDAREIQDDLTCLAVPLCPKGGEAIAAISLSQAPDIPSAAKQKNMLLHLRRTAESILSLI